MACGLSSSLPYASLANLVTWSLSHRAHLLYFEKAIATISRYWWFNPTVGDNLPQNFAGHYQSMPCQIACFQVRDRLTPYSLPPFVMTIFRNELINCLKILIVYFSMFVLDTHQFLLQTTTSWRFIYFLFFIIVIVKKSTFEYYSFYCNNKNDYFIFRIIPNYITKVKNERRRVFVGNQLDEIKDYSGLFYLYAFERVSYLMLLLMNINCVNVGKNSRF